MSGPTSRPLLAVALAGAGACGLMFWIMTHGPGVSPDSVGYIETARSLLAGDGFSILGRPMTEFPPMYPLLLAGAGLIDHDLLRAGRFLHASLFGANVALVALAVYLSADRNLLAAGCAALLFLSSAPIISVHSMAWSESPFFAFSLAGFVLLCLHVARPAPTVLVTAALAVGLASATRYAGVSLLAPLLYGLLCLGNRSRRQRLCDVSIALPIACAPLAIWSYRNLMTGRSVMGRGLAVHPIVSSPGEELVDTLYEFALPTSAPVWAKTVLLAMATVLVLAALGAVHRDRRRSGSSHSPAVVLPWFIVLLAGAYIVLVFGSVWFVDAGISLDTRILFPIWGLAVVAAVSLGASASHAMGRPAIGWSLVFICLFFVGINGDRAARTALDLRRNGSGYTSRQWRGSEIMAFVRSRVQTTRIYSNGPEAIRFLTGREAAMIPRRVSPVTASPNEHYEEELGVMCRDSRERGALVVYLDSVWRWYLPAHDEVASTCGLAVQERFADGRVYAASR
jgi:hypothetical protein